MSYTTVTYSLSPRQVMTLDVPIGDPYGGPAYGQKLKGGGGLGMVLGVVAAVATGGMGLAAWSAASAAGSIGGMLSAGAMMTGGVMAGIGAVTGNQKLAKYGGYLSLAGGLGASMMTSGGEFLNPLAENAGKESLMSEAMTKVSDTFSSAAKELGFTGKESSTLSGVNQSVTEGVTGNGVGNLTQSSGNMSVAPDLGGVTNELAGVNQNLNQSVAGMPATNYEVGGTLNTSGKLGTAAGADSGIALGANSGVPAPYVSQYPGANAVVQPLTQQAPAASGGFGLMDFAKSNGGGLIGASLMQGLGGAMSQQEQLDFLQQQYSDKQDLLHQQLANINFKYEALDPNDPQYQQKLSAAKAAGIPTITLGVNKNANVAMPNLFPATQQPVAQNQGVPA